MLKTSFTLTAKTPLTHDVYELVYSCPDLSRELPKAGQYVMFQLAPGLNRAYSLASFTADTFTLIMKRIDGGRGSPILCDAEVGTTFSGMIPLGHFTLEDTPRSKCFIGTGTGFAPVYCQMLQASEKAIKPTKVAFIFGVRNFRDSFYTGEILDIGTRFSDFEYRAYFSRESEFGDDGGTHQHAGYVTDALTPELISAYEEYYICGSPAMVKSAREILESLGIPKSDIHWEQF